MDITSLAGGVVLHRGTYDEHSNVVLTEEEWASIKTRVLAEVAHANGVRIEPLESNASIYRRRAELAEAHRRMVRRQLERAEAMTSIARGAEPREAVKHE